MRIAYFAPFQGPDLLAFRPSVHNASLAARVKIALVAELLKGNGHDIEIFSQGEVDRYECKFFPAFEERNRFHKDIPVFYPSALPVRLVNGLWASWRTLSLFKQRHRRGRFDLVIIYNLKRGHMTCASYAQKVLRIPAVLEYEDDSFVDVRGVAIQGVLSSYHRNLQSRTLREISGCIGVSPYLLSQAAEDIPKLLLRGIVNRYIARFASEPDRSRKSWVVFSGTHEGTQGLEQMVSAWTRNSPPGWELHIAGNGPITERLHQLAGGCSSIIFRGLLNREQNAEMISSARIGMNPQDVTKTPGNVFPFKVIEYLAAGLHVISTPRGKLEPELEHGVTYIQDNSSEAISRAIHRLVARSDSLETAVGAAMRTYGPDAVAADIETLIAQVASRWSSRSSSRVSTARARSSSEAQLMKL